jgi:protein-disulfide isomerase
MARLAGACKNAWMRTRLVRGAWLALIASCHPQPAATTAKPGATGDLETRVKRLEDRFAKYAEALDFLGKVYDQQKAQQAAEERDAPAPDAMFAIDIAGDVKAGQVDGPAGAAVTIVKAFDFACPYCQRMVAPLDELVAEYKGKVRVVYKNLVIHPVAMSAHLASCAAAKQGKYMAFRTAFWDKAYAAYASSHDPGKLGEDSIAAIAADLRLDAKRLVADMRSDECKARIDVDMQELAKFHINSTPTFFINGQVVAGALPKEDFKELIDAKLAAVASSGVPAGDYYDKVVMAKGEKKFRSKTDPAPK